MDVQTWHATFPSDSTTVTSQAYLKAGSSAPWHLSETHAIYKLGVQAELINQCKQCLKTKALGYSSRDWLWTKLHWPRAKHHIKSYAIVHVLARVSLSFMVTALYRSVSQSPGPRLKRKKTNMLLLGSTGCWKWNLTVATHIFTSQYGLHTQSHYFA